MFTREQINMKTILEYLAQDVKTVQFIIHKHDPRNGSLHYDLRFLDAHDNSRLHSFAFQSDFIETLNDNKPCLGVKTKDHDPRWLTLKSYRLTDIDKGLCDIRMSTSKYFNIEFKGKILKGVYKIFKVKTGRGDNWILSRMK